VDFWLGTHQADWLGKHAVELFVSQRRLADRVRLPGPALAAWALDSGGFTELRMYGEWRTTHAAYRRSCATYAAEIGRLAWVAPQDWMCEPFMLQRTGLSVAEHQARTIRSYLALRFDGVPVIPVLQGYALADYQRCWAAYEEAGIQLEDEPLVGLGSVCRRQATHEIGAILRSLRPLRLHGFGVKLQGIALYGSELASADSLAWSYDARRASPLPGCSHRTCASCARYALRWRGRALRAIREQQLALFDGPERRAARREGRAALVLQHAPERYPERRR
jgi:hypothetical protein